MLENQKTGTLLKFIVDLTITSKELPLTPTTPISIRFTDSPFKHTITAGKDVYGFGKATVTRLGTFASTAPQST